MDNSRFDQMIKPLITKNRSRDSSGNVVAEASKLLEITNAISDIEREVEQRKSVIMENLQRHESLIATSGRWYTGFAACKLAVFDDELRDFEENARLRIIEIEETRKVFTQDLRNEDEDRQKVREIIRKMSQFREDVVEEITIVDQNISLLTSQLKDMSERLKRIKIENNDLLAQIERQENNLKRRSQEKLAKLNQLMVSKD